ncbi:hypothetical protein ACFYOD_06485 [Streptomyces sp. NPDC006703]|uniref:hypothetical protein n=1 Tax=Streptomyces sp. NPDC006703 TaxID=3364759 RepID=UPI0036B4A165
MPAAFTEPPARAVAADAHWAAKMAKLRARRLPERTIAFVDDPLLRTARNEAVLKLAAARAQAENAADDQAVPNGEREQWVATRPEVVAAELAAGTAQEVLDEATVELMFRALPRPAWEQLLREHPPTEEQADQGMEYNVDTYPAALISASSVDGMSVDEAQELLDTWSDSEAKALFTGALMVNQQLRADLGKG